MTTSRGTLYLVPNGLDVGTGDAEADLGERLPLGTLRVAARLGHWVGENAKTTRAFLKRVDAVCRLARPLQEIAIVELPRPPKGRPDTATFEGDRLLAPALAGHDVGLISEAGLPAVADPGRATRRRGARAPEFASSPCRARARSRLPSRRAASTARASLSSATCRPRRMRAPRASASSRRHRGAWRRRR